jgi:curved DNA-binding protein CbpA
LTASDKRRDPYTTLGVRPGVSDQELRSAYRRLVRLHHPDHNGGSLESTRRFEEIQDAYGKITAERRRAGPPPRQSSASSPPPSDPNLDARIASMERDLRDAYIARERARNAAREAAREQAAQTFKRPTDEELGYVTTNDTLSKIISDAREELSKRLSDAREHPVVKRVEDLIDDLGERYKPRP